MSFLRSPLEITRSLAERLREARLQAELTQAGLARRSGVSLASLRRFESTGEVSLASLVKLAVALGCESQLEALFAPSVTGLAALLMQPVRRKRGSRG